MKVSLSYLKNELLSHVCEIVFPRRRPLSWRSPVRKMLCTNSFDLLNSFNGHMVLNYHAPSLRLPYDPESKNLIVSFDIIMMDFRQIPMDNCDLVQSLPADDTFWKYFNEKIYIMSTQQKMLYMDY